MTLILWSLWSCNRTTMLVLGRNIACRLLLALCVLAQGVAFMPHHHHGDSEVPCFELAHCHRTAHEQSQPKDDGCCQGHQHNDAGDPCEQLLTSGDRLAAHNTEGKITPPSPVDISYLSAPACAYVCVTEELSATVFKSGFRGELPPNNHYLYIITRIMPTRAPAVVA